jgi:anaerobic ribonucleoside-triphosphate reductase
VGISSHNINETLSFFAKKNFRKNFIDVYRLLHNISTASLDETIFNLENLYGDIDSGNVRLEKMYEREFTEAKNKTRKDIYDACQIFEYQINSISCQS